MLKTIRIKNFRSIQDSGEISLTSGITILVGQNESGKTSILEAINYFGNFFTNGFIRKPFLGENNFDEPFVDYELNADLVLQNSKVQTAEFTYSTNKQFRQRLQKLATKKIFLKNAGIQKFYISNLKNLENIKEYKISLHIDCTKNNNIAEIDIDNRFLLFFSKILKKKEEKNNQIKTARTILTQKEVAKIIWFLSPKIILFNPKNKILPDEITIRALRERYEWGRGYYAVKNLETLMKINFCEIASKTKTQKKNLMECLSKEISVNFQKAWKQKIHIDNKIKITIDIVKDWVKFYVNSKENQSIPPRKRSAGMIWFLSFWLELMVHKNNEEKVILLFDEPGNNLHNKGSEDVLSVFEELTAKDHQIIFSTHRPNLITKTLSRVRIVVNDEKKGTIVETIPKSKVNVQNRRDAFCPIIISMGINLSKEMGILFEKNVILEGMSDYFYFEGMRRLLKRDNSYKFVPGIGVKSDKIMPLISFCIGYGIKFVVILDKEYYAEKTEKILKKELLEIIEKKIIFLSKPGIEEMFSPKDWKLITSQINIKNRNNNLDAFNKEQKVINAVKFLTLVENNEINKKNLDSKTIKDFESIFSDLEKKLKETK